MANTPTNTMSEVAHPDTYIGQTQPIGGTANTTTPPLVTVTNPTGGSTPFISVVNSTVAALGAGATFTGAWEDVSGYNSITLIGEADVPGTVYFDFSSDGVTVMLTNQLTTGLDGDFEDSYSSVCSRYFRARIVNGVAPQGSMKIQTIYNSGARVHLSPIGNGLKNFSSAQITLAAGFAQHENGVIWDKYRISESHNLKVEISDPVNAFGEFVNTELTPLVGVNAVYGIRDTDTQTSVGGTGGAVAANSLFTCTTGVGVGGYGLIKSIRPLKYYDGLGLRLRGTSQFTAPQALSYQFFGMFTSTDGLFFGYDGLVFGAIRRIAGAVSIQRLTITVGAGAAEVVTITLDGVAFNLAPTPGVLTASQLAQYIVSLGSSFTGWTSDVSPTSNGTGGIYTVTFLQNVPAVTSGAFTLSSAGTARGTFATIQAGAANTLNTMPQTAFNVDVLDGSNTQENPSGMLLDKTKLNVYQIVYPYLGGGSIKFFVMNPDTSRMTLCHIEKYTNAYNITSQKNPSFRAGWISASLGSAVNLTVSGGSASGFVEGKIEPTRNPQGKEFTKTVNTVDQVVIAFRIRNEFSGIVNQSDLLLYTVRAAVETTNRLISYAIYLNPTLPTNIDTDWQYVNQTRSVVEFATPVGMAITDGQFISGGGAAGGSAESVCNLAELKVKIQAGDIFVITSHTIANTSPVTFVTTWQEN